MTVLPPPRTSIVLDLRTLALTLEGRVAKLEKELIGEWLDMEAYSARINEKAVEGTNSAGVIRLRGYFTVGEELTGEDELFTLPVSLRPTTTKYLTLLNASTSVNQRLTISPTGVCRWFGPAASVASLISVDTISFSRE